MPPIGLKDFQLNDYCRRLVYFISRGRRIKTS